MAKNSREWEIILIFKFFIESKLFAIMAYSYFGILISYNCFKKICFLNVIKTSSELKFIKKDKEN